MLVILVRAGGYMVEEGAETRTVHLDVQCGLYDTYSRRKDICDINVNSITVNFIFDLLASCACGYPRGLKSCMNRSNLHAESKLTLDANVNLSIHTAPNLPDAINN